MSLPQSVDDILNLYATRGTESYGEGVDMIAHALQCATLAQGDGAPDALVVAALLHDVGHLVVDRQGDAVYVMDEDDDRHEAVGARVLAPLFGSVVAQPVVLHVTAKRYRCATEPAYYDLLSATSQATLRAQGGPLDAEACARFRAHPGFAGAMRLRQWDDLAKVPDASTQSWDVFRPLLDRLLDH